MARSSSSFIVSSDTWSRFPFAFVMFPFAGAKFPFALPTDSRSHSRHRSARGDGRGVGRKSLGCAGASWHCRNSWPVGRAKHVEQTATGRVLHSATGETEGRGRVAGSDYKNSLHPRRRLPAYPSGAKARVQYSTNVVGEGRNVEQIVSSRGLEHFSAKRSFSHTAVQGWRDGVRRIWLFVVSPLPPTHHHPPRARTASASSFHCFCQVETQGVRRN